MGENSAAIRRTAEDIAKFHCTPGTMDGCQIAHDDEDGDSLILCRTCRELADRIEAAIRAYAG